MLKNIIDFFLFRDRKKEIMERTAQRILLPALEKTEAEIRLRIAGVLPQEERKSIIRTSI